MLVTIKETNTPYGVTISRKVRLPKGLKIEHIACLYAHRLHEVFWDDESKSITIPYFPQCDVIDEKTLEIDFAWFTKCTQISPDYAGLDVKILPFMLSRYRNIFDVLTTPQKPIKMP